MPQVAQRRSVGSELVTAGIRVSVVPQYVPPRSSPSQGRYVFSYTITIGNESDRGVQLLSRRWRIVDAEGEAHEVEGEGVVGRQPRLAPGESHQYSSFCPLTTAWGTMEGTFTMQDEQGGTFPVRVGRFYFVSPHS